MIRRAAPVLAALAGALVLPGCATPETRLRSALVEAGLSEPMAACMAERMVDRLSLAQLHRMSDLGKAGGARSTDEFLHRVRSLRDPEILRVTSAAAARCVLDAGAR